jgi:hypothetical protein
MGPESQSPFLVFNRMAWIWSWILTTALANCGGRLDDNGQSSDVRTDTSNPPNVVPVTPAPRASTDVPQSQSDACIPLSAPTPEVSLDDLQIEFACGIHSANTGEYSEYYGNGQICENSKGINTFALRLIGSAAPRYSAVVRCGYLRYDNGTFVGERVEVEARDGRWCHETGLQHIDLVDRMLLTDVSFAIDALDAVAPKRHLAIQFSMLSGWTNPVPAETNLCLYVAHLQLGAYACAMASPAPYCVCPCDTMWQSFPMAMSLSLVSD